MFPTPRHDNVGIYQVGSGSAVPFSVLMVDAIPDLHVTGAGSGGQFFPRWTWESVGAETLDLGGEGEVVDDYRRIDNITDASLSRFQAAYGSDWTKDDVFYCCYGLLHSPDYRATYAADLRKVLPRIPLLTDPGDARAFADAGRRLSELHLGYESVEPYPLDGLEVDGPTGDAAYDFFAVGAKKMRFGDNGKDRSLLHYNDRMTLSGIPEEAHRYQLGSRSAIEWIIDRYYIKSDKASGIVNDPNDWSREVGDPRYILDLIARIVAVSMNTMEAVDGLPPLAIRDEQK